MEKRKLDSHKGDYGKVLIVAGQKGMAGAACLCAKTALRAGSGLVQVAVNDDILQIVQEVVPEATCVDRKDISLDYDAIAFGPGLGTDEKDLLVRILDEYEGYLVIDADGLNTIAKFDLYSKVKNSKAKVVITPHMGEAKRLVEEGPREEMAYALREKLGAVVVLKGHETIVLDDQLWINDTGNPGMATAGSGDVLTGVITSFLGQGLTVREAVHIHGKAGDMMAEVIGEYGLISSDICMAVALAIKEENL
ncbi:MAG: NAD(P)H-hydrate dehydratase [Clostridia bacterium]|nr:NAD(P)H-hydrate dehydratase [Clostridia bacterium]